MKKTLVVVVILMLSLSLLGCGQEKKDQQGTSQPNETAVKQTVSKLVEDFGGKLKMVSLLAPQDTVKQSMQENYANYVTPDLLSKWQKEPDNAPGRVSSSPWPDRIEIKSVQKLSVDRYEVKGEIIEITSTEVGTDKSAARRPITCTVKKLAAGWRIDAATLGDYIREGLYYRNTQYGFDFKLPETWRGYSIVNEKWEGLTLGAQEKVVSGPQILIRHPQWSKENPRQDIPIMVFTQAQWQDLQQEKFHIGAAPMGPSELGRNADYVFALPARYNYAFPSGYEEVEEILAAQPLMAIK
jgi:hypothetical protein